MARSQYIYLIEQNLPGGSNIVMAAFTVKREMVQMLRGMATTWAAGIFSDVTVSRVRDGHVAHRHYYPVRELLGGTA